MKKREEEEGRVVRCKEGGRWTSERGRNRKGENRKVREGGDMK